MIIETQIRRGESLPIWPVGAAVAKNSKSGEWTPTDQCESPRFHGRVIRCHADSVVVEVVDSCLDSEPIIVNAGAAGAADDGDADFDDAATVGA